MEELNICDIFLNRKDKSKITLEISVKEGFEREVIQELYKSFNGESDIVKGAKVSKIYFGDNAVEDIIEEDKKNMLLHIDSLIESLQTNREKINKKANYSSIFKLQ